MNIIEEQMEFLEKSTKDTFRKIPIKEEFDETAAENLAEKTAEEEGLTDEPVDKEFNETNQENE